MKSLQKPGHILLLLFISPVFLFFITAQDLKDNRELDEQVKSFLDSQSGQRHDMNVPEEDIQLLYDDVDPKLRVGGCYTSHNVYGESTGDDSWHAVYLRYLKSLSNYETAVNTQGAGVAISYKRAEK